MRASLLAQCALCTHCSHSSLPAFFTPPPPPTHLLLEHALGVVGACASGPPDADATRDVADALFTHCGRTQLPA
eukprot:3985495-Pleurochrysis_carterae.AAC.8